MKGLSHVGAAQAGLHGLVLKSQAHARADGLPRTLSGGLKQNRGVVHEARFVVDPARDVAADAMGAEEAPNGGPGGGRSAVWKACVGFACIRSSGGNAGVWQSSVGCSSIATSGIHRASVWLGHSTVGDHPRVARLVLTADRVLGTSGKLGSPTA